MHQDNELTGTFEPCVHPDDPHHLATRRIESSGGVAGELAHIHSATRRIHALDQPLHADRTRLLDDQP
ncbi:hypothetical protein, partial [Streptomyces sp. SID339]|uniref:hypothetical protein n=1 Tax=Streptomyces sp. SID339 TaxID=2706080 RepID=UPI0013681C77